jgi:glycosyltransferase involved in cell wall biosynthesis
MEQKISGIMVIHNEEKLIRRALESIKDVTDEILILHDGPCSDKSLDIAKKYTKKVFETKKNTGLPGPILPILFRKAKGPWILKIDADEYLSKEMKNNLRRLTQNSEVNGYTFRWPMWDGKKYVTKNWPRKPSLYRKSKISYLGFPHFDDPKISGKIIDTDYQLMHKPILKYPLHSWKDLIHKGLYRYGRIQAEWTLKSFKELDKFQYKEKNFPRNIRIRKDYPLLSAIPIAVIGFFRVILTNNAWKEGMPVFKEAGQSFLYYLYVGLKIHKFKNLEKNQIKI